MTKKWTNTQTIIAAVLQAWAVFFLCSITSEIITRLHQGVQLNLIKTPEVNNSFGTLFKLYHVNYLAGILALYGGLALMFDKKGGYIASLGATILFTGFFLISGRNGVVSAANGKGIPLSYLASGLLFGAMFILLVTKPFRQKFKPSFIHWLAIGVFLALVIIDKQTIGG